MARHLGASLFEIVWLPNLDQKRLSATTTFEGLENALEMVRGGRSVFPFTGHSVTWERPAFPVRPPPPVAAPQPGVLGVPGPHGNEAGGGLMPVVRRGDVLVGSETANVIRDVGQCSLEVAACPGLVVGLHGGERIRIRVWQGDSFG